MRSDSREVFRRFETETFNTDRRIAAAPTGDMPPWYFISSEDPCSERVRNDGGIPTAHGRPLRLSCVQL